jgi:uncharacterized membrane protein
MLVTIASELFMSWGYWGIVGGLLSMVVVLFVSVEILYARVRKGLDESVDTSTRTATTTPTAGRHAA